MSLHDYEEIRKESDRKRRKIIKRDNSRCVICGSKDFLEVHHKLAVYRGGGAEDENLVTLCKPCHKHATETGIEDFEKYRNNPELSIWKRMTRSKKINHGLKFTAYQFISDKLDEWEESGFVSKETKTKILAQEAKDLDEEFDSYLQGG